MFEKEKGLKICKTIHTNFCGAWGFLLMDEKNIFSQPLQCKKIALKFVIFLFNKYYYLFFWFFGIFF